ncbi:MAG TPA: hypothetical protein VIK02_08790 [Candidatus Anoxymicrobiaceae bacterium]
MKTRLKRYAKIGAMVALVAFMLNTILMLGQLKGLDSKLSTNSSLLARAIAYEQAMGCKSEGIVKMASRFEALLKKMQTARSLASQIAGDADQIRQMNDQLLAANSEIDTVIVQNFDMAQGIASKMSAVVNTMGNAGSLLGEIGQSAMGQLSKVARMYSLAVQNNAALPALP